MPDLLAPMVWVDVETTGLDPTFDQLLEVAILVTDSELEPHAGYSSVVRQPELVTMDQVVWDMHTQSGLLQQVQDGLGKHLWEISEDICELLRKQGVDSKSPLCGSTVHFDRGFIKRDLPAVEALLHYRNVDVSSLRELIARWAPDQLWEKKDAHRAMDDIYDSIKQLKHYRKVFCL